MGRSLPSSKFLVGLAVITVVPPMLWNALDNKSEANATFWFALGLVWAVEGVISWASLVPTTPVIDNSHFDWVEELEANWKDIRAELDEVTVDLDKIPEFMDLSPEQGVVVKEKAWKTYFFLAYGIWSEDNGARCPKTLKALKSIPELKSAFFSILMPHQHIVPHRGPYKGVLRVHLGLKIPQPTSQCAIRVGNETVHWEEGRVVFLDDSMDHEAWNNSSETRVVLFLDVMRPLRFPFNIFNNAVVKIMSLSPVVQKGVQATQKWNQRVYAKAVEQEA